MTRADWCWRRVCDDHPDFNTIWWIRHEPAIYPPDDLYDHGLLAFDVRIRGGHGWVAVLDGVVMTVRCDHDAELVRIIRNHIGESDGSWGHRSEVNYWYGIAQGKPQRMTDGDIFEFTSYNNPIPRLMVEGDL